ncbi:MAG: hypothetical protein ACXVSL_00300 [Solirubrobacteraceae bacterium]
MQGFPKRKLAIGSTVLAVAAFAGGAVAATQGSSQNPRQQYLNDVAKRLNVTPAQLESALKGASLDQLQAAVKAGKLTQAQANALKQRIQHGAAGGAPFIGPPPPFGPRGFGPGPFGLHRALLFGPAAGAAKYLGLTEAQLVKQLQSGESLADIAKAQGKTTAGLEQAITSSLKARLDKAVANKRITAAQEQQLLKGLSARINDLVNNTPRKLPGPGAPGPLGLHAGLLFGPATAVAKYLGLTRAQLVKQLESGKSLADIAKAQGKTTSGLEQAITDAVRTRLDKAVANKRITAAQEQQMLKALSARMNDLVTNAPPGPARFGGRGFGYHKAFRGGFARPGSLVPAPPAPAGPFA